jgi:hypothetical protein
MSFVRQAVLLGSLLVSFGFAGPSAVALGSLTPMPPWPLQTAHNRDDPPSSTLARSVVPSSDLPRTGTDLWLQLLAAIVFILAGLIVRTPRGTARR